MASTEQPEDVEPRIRFLAAAAALRAIDTAVTAARHDAADRARPDRPDTAPDSLPDPDDALAALVLLRELRARLATWEPDLIEDARQAGASWAALAEPLGVASRQAAERRYLRLRPGGAPGTTGDQRVQATRDQRAADRAVNTWAREHAAGLRTLAGQITALDDLTPQAQQSQAELTTALGHDDPARLLAPLTATRPHLDPDHPDLGARMDALTHQVDRLRRASDDQRLRGT